MNVVIIDEDTDFDNIFFKEVDVEELHEIIENATGDSKDEKIQVS